MMVTADKNIRDVPADIDQRAALKKHRKRLPFELRFATNHRTTIQDRNA